MYLRTIARISRLQSSQCMHKPDAKTFQAELSCSSGDSSVGCGFRSFPSSVFRSINCATDWKDAGVP